MNNYIVYVITNKVNGKKYVGVTRVSLQSRLSSHFKKRTKEQCRTKFNYAVLKYGVSNFDVSVIETDVPMDQIEDRERYYIQLYDSYNHGYNSTQGGNGTVGYIFTDKVREKMRRAYNKEKNITEARNRKISEALKGRPKSDLQKLRLSISKKNYYKTHINHFKGKHHSEASKLKISRSNSIYKVQMLDRYNESVIRTFDTMMDACRWIKQTQNRAAPLTTIRFRIGQFIRGKCIGGSHAIYGYKWRYLSE